jgi:ABC-2 type transport system ATP-binding protein
LTASSPAVATTANGPSGADIAVRDLTKTYKGDVRALRGVTFDVAPGTVFGLLGPNGAGKSTTVKILTTLSRADSGTATVGGVDVDAHPDRVRRIIGCVAQQSACDLDATGFENLALQGQLYGLHGNALRSRATELLEQFGLADAAKRITKTYSGGMQRKLDVAMGLMHRPRVLFLDEPTTGLDPQARSEMWTEISRLAREEGLTVLLTTHYLEEADKLADDLAIVDNGVVVARGAPEELKSELHGDAVVVEFATEPDADALRDSVASQQLREVAIDGRSMRGRADNGATALPAVLVALESAGFPVESARVARPSLDDVYIRHTVHPYAATGAQNPDTAKEHAR